MSLNCVDCSCQQIPLDDNICQNLHEMNNSKVKGASLVLKDTRLCDYPKVFPKSLYSIWCVLKNIIAVICYILTEIKKLWDEIAKIKDKINEMIDALNRLCNDIQCIINFLKKEAKEKAKEAIGNVAFSMGSGGTAENALGGTTYTAINTTNDGGFTIQWNMIGENGEVGTGTISGRVNHSYTPNDDGSIQANIMGFTINSVVYNNNGTKSAAGPASFTIRDNSGGTVWSRSYHPNDSFSESPNATVNYNISKALAPNGGTSGTVPILTTYDDWEIADTEGHVNAQYVNNNKPIFPFECESTCTHLTNIA